MTRWRHRRWSLHQFGDAREDYILLIEPRWEGHRPYFVELMTEAALQRGLGVVWAINLHSPVLEIDSSLVRSYFFSSDEVRGDFSEVSTAVTGLRDGNLVATYLLDGDSQLASFAYWQLRNLRILLLRSPYCFPGSSRIRTLAKKFLCKVAEHRGVLIFHLTLPGSESSKRKQRMVLDPSPFVSLSELPIPVGIPKATELAWVGVFGFQDARKNIPLLVEALAIPRGRRVGLRIVGPWEDQELLHKVVRRCADSAVTLELHPERVSTEELRAQIDSTDVICVLNTNEASSGILMAASSRGKPIVLSGSCALRRASQHFGAIWSEPNPSSLAQAISKALEPLGDTLNYRPTKDGTEFTTPLLAGLP